MPPLLKSEQYYPIPPNTNRKRNSKLVQTICVNPTYSVYYQNWVGIINRGYLKNRKMIRGQGWRRIVPGGIYINISRITIQARRRDRAI